MCDADYGDRADIWNEVRPKARKSHRCLRCDRLILPGEVYLKATSLLESQWATYKVHMACYELTKYIAFDVCDQETYFLDCDYDLRWNVREHMEEDPKVLVMYRDHLRERNRMEKQHALRT